MLVAVFPAQPTPALTEALLAAGLRPVPVIDATDVADREPPDGWSLVVVELSTDDPTVGLMVARRVRETYAYPVLVVADRTQTARLSDTGTAEDFILTPIDIEELRVRSGRIARGGDVESGDEVFSFKDLELNLATYQAVVGGVALDLTFMEYELLRFFVANRARVWTREQILAKVWGYDYFGGSRTVDVHVRRLRAKLGEERASWISTVRSVGYRFG